MKFELDTSPHLQPTASVHRVMLHVLLGLIPGAIAMIWFFGWGVWFNIVIAIVTATGAEAMMIRSRGGDARATLHDLSAVVTAVLLALALPPLAPWWLTVTGSLFAIIITKQLFGGLGFNPFNPAMAGYAALLISFPREMTQWIPPSMIAEHPLGLWDTLVVTFAGSLPDQLPWDAVTAATPLDLMKTRLGLMDTIGEIRSNILFGDFGGRGWEWVGNWFFVGGLWLLYKRIITWHIPVAVLGSLFTISLLFYLTNPDAHPTPLFHIFSGGAVVCAFFIATDPVSGCASAKGRLLFGACVGILIFVIRTWGGYPDGVAFAVLLMNLAAPSIDYFTRPRVFGEDRGS
ncbi:MAG TPA: electron transport complex subunit RsxD [Chromatiaceae bacterium]|jgi:electron transport complex protein RnfD|nr:electron transport complex subunit RsxD [Chromatiaceae bacterium]HIN82999.1 electron transport complex subunit RsxD [Chromatiales bacterium]HIA09121.1 electron transport complex subunit RsxD [Chromatiaceae bacterium]HIB85021.1 electron transport complex subunit RsxD [Chromatiaceae bacterium]HIO13887.1 electron transport complex subunit RsxD [Chromatiales bacterium]